MLEFNAHPLDDDALTAYTEEELLAAGRRADNEYLRKYRRMHPEKFREYRRRAKMRAGARLLAEEAAAVTAGIDGGSDSEEA